MNKPKILKQIKFENCIGTDCRICPRKANVAICFAKDLRKEAKKWLKYYREELKHKNSHWTGLAGKVDFIKEFFGVDEE